jgi:hypothetical protein
MRAPLSVLLPVASFTTAFMLHVFASFTICSAELGPKITFRRQNVVHVHVTHRTSIEDWETSGFVT